MNLMKNFLFLSLIVIFLGAGCLPTTPDRVNDRQITQNPDGRFDYTDSETGGQASLGEGAAIPDSFPSDIPLYSNGKITAAIFVPNEGAQLMFDSTDLPESVFDWYENQFIESGWKKEFGLTEPDQWSGAYTKGIVTISVMVSSFEGKTSAVITRGEE